MITNIFAHYRESVWGVLTGQGGDNVSSLVVHEVREIETWILRLLSAPVPVPGKTRVEVGSCSTCSCGHLPFLHYQLVASLEIINIGNTGNQNQLLVTCFSNMDYL